MYLCTVFSKNMVEVFEFIYDALMRRRVLAAVLLAVLVAGAVALALRLDYEEDIARFLPLSEENERYAEAYHQMAGKNRIIVTFTGSDSDSIEAAMDSFAAHWEEVDTAHSVGDLTVRSDETQMLDLLNVVYENAPLYLTDSDWQRIDSLLSVPGYVDEQMSENKQQLLLPTAGALMDALRYDPLHLFSPMLGRLQQLRMNDGFKMQDGCVFTADGHTALAFLTSPYGISESMHNSRLQEMIDETTRRAANDVPGVKMLAVGAPLIAAGNANQIKRDSLMAVSISVVLILLLLVWHYRRLSYLMWIGLSIAFGCLFAIAGLSLLRHSVSIIVLGVGSVIIGIAVNYPLHYLDHLLETGDRRQTLRDMVPPLLIGNITTVSAFLCLVWLDSAAMRDLGLFGSLMLIGTILFVLIILPLWARPKAPNNVSPALSDEACQSKKRPVVRSGWLFWSFVVLTLILGYFSLQTSFDADIRHINYMTDDQREGLALLSDYNNDAAVYVVAEGKTLEEALQRNETVVQPALRQLQADGVVSRISGVSSFMPSLQAQQRQSERWKDFWHQHGASVLAQLKAAAAREGFSDDAFEPFVNSLKGAPMPAFGDDSPSLKGASSRSVSTTPTVKEDNALCEAFSAYVQQDSAVVRIVSFVETEQESAVKSFLNSRSDRQAFAFSSKDVSNQLVEILSDSFNYIGFVCGFVVFFFLWLSFGSIELALLSFLPLAVSWLWILGAMQLLGIQFNIVNIILATFIFGQGDDYTIFITEGLIYEYATGRRRLSSYRRSVILSAVIMFIGMGTLILAKHPALRSLAEVTIVGMGTVVVMAYCLPPLVFKWLVRGRLRPATAVSRHPGAPLPITLRRIANSVFAMGFFLSCMYLFVLPYTWIYFHVGESTEERKLRYHAMLQRLSNFVIHRVPGVKFFLTNRVGETFERPAVVISNHQSHLDLMCLMMLTPKIVYLTNDSEWHNPYYGMVIHRAEFYPVSSGIENHVEQLRQLYRRGYSICVFPEGTRSEDCSILRFHKGAFFLAEQLGADILPIYLHGAGHVLPKRDFLLRQGRIDVEVGERIAPDDSRFSVELLARTKEMRHHYEDRYRRLCLQIETGDYWRYCQHYIDKYTCGYDKG